MSAKREWGSSAHLAASFFFWLVSVSWELFRVWAHSVWIESWAESGRMGGGNRVGLRKLSGKRKCCKCWESQPAKRPTGSNNTCQRFAIAVGINRTLASAILNILKTKVFKATVIRDLITIICLSIFAGEFAADVQSGSLCTYAFVSWQLKVCKAIRQLSSWRSLARMHWMSVRKKKTDIENNRNKQESPNENKMPNNWKFIKAGRCGNRRQYRNQMQYSTLNCNAGWGSAGSGTPWHNCFGQAKTLLSVVVATNPGDTKVMHEVFYGKNGSQ